MPKGKTKYSSVTSKAKPSTGKKRPGSSAKNKARKSMKSAHGSSHGSSHY